MKGTNKEEERERNKNPPVIGRLPSLCPGCYLRDIETGFRQPRNVFLEPYPERVMRLFRRQTPAIDFPRRFPFQPGPCRPADIGVRRRGRLETPV